ncbi:hypothetical protein DSO57_1016941 [Entomophthora muscae]|uniref:Uncharacterized protein n=1 Tax=Entomophthora muscae TaxID=34485 RepID=A0ACC2TFN2_9FUNG|nr:hypothetical protein DSO57_1016941 [Entomophthora muscae]
MVPLDPIRGCRSKGIKLDFGRFPAKSTSKIGWHRGAAVKNHSPKPQRYTFVATELPGSPANVSYNTQGALDETLLDVSNDMD